MNVAKTTVISVKALVTIIYYLKKKKKVFKLFKCLFSKSTHFQTNAFCYGSYNAFITENITDKFKMCKVVVSE